MTTQIQQPRELTRGESYELGEGVVPTRLSWCIPWIVVNNSPDRIIVVNFGLKATARKALYEIYDCRAGKGRPEYLEVGITCEPEDFFRIAQEHFPTAMEKVRGNQ